MASAPFGAVMRHLFQRLGARPAADPSDAGLLAQFATERDEAAFAELVRRHGPLVLGVCRRVLRDADAADDVFQAAFLVLARKAGSLDGRRPLGCWLYTVARNLALKHRLADARRQAREKEAGAMRNSPSSDQTDQREAAAVLDAELGQLPEKYRAPLVLCHLQGLTHEAAARELGWPAGSIAKRLARGLDLLRDRLTGRGIALPATGLAALLGEHVSAAVSPALVVQLSRAAVLYAAGQATAGLVSTSAAALADSALPALVLFRWKLTAAVLLGLGVLGAGAAVFGHRAEPAEVASAPVPEEPPPPAPEEDPRDRELRRRLARTVHLDKGIDLDTPLQDALDVIADRHELKVRLDRDAFAAAGVVAVDESLVGLPRLQLPLGTVLCLILRQIEPRDGRVAGYRLEQGVLVIAPLFLENQPSERFPRGLPERLFKPVRCARLPFDMTLGEAVEFYGKLYGQKIVLDQQAFAAGGEANADQYPLAGRGRELPEAPCLLEILDLILWQTDGANWKSCFHVRDGAIEITAAKRETAQAQQLTAHQDTIREYWELWKSLPGLGGQLGQRVNLDKGIDANTALKDALDFLCDRYDLSLFVDESAFTAVGLTKVVEHPVRLEPVLGVPLETVLRRLLDQVKNDHFTASLVQREGFLEIVPEYNQLRQKKPLEAQHLDRLWKDLGNPNGGVARLAVRTLAQAPQEALPFLKERIKPPAAKDPKLAERIRLLVADLDSDKFAVRQQATEGLVKLGAAALPALHHRLMGAPSLEVRTRIEQILERLGDFPKAELVRPLRAVRVLEALGTPTARQLLETLADGDRDAPLTHAARAALDRLKP
jgi:RNA polymerase sigma factor (sigma-70 family)